MMLAVVPNVYAEISVTQTGLTPEEQKVLDDIEQQKAEGTYVQPPEAQLTANIQKYSEDVLTSIPFPVSHQYCGSVEWNLNTPEITCVYVGKTNTAIWTAQDEADALSEKLEADAKSYEERAMALTDDQRQIIAIQNTLDDLYLIENPTISQQKQIDVLTEANYCTLRGIGNSEATQTKGFFELPKDAIQIINGKLVIVMPQVEDGKTNDLKDRSPFAKSSLLVEECKAQIIHENIVLPKHYQDMVMTEDDFQPRHQDKATVKTAMPSRNDSDFATEESKSNDIICNSQNYSAKFKKQMGCETDIEYEGSFKNTGGLTTEDAVPQINHRMHELVCGIIPYGHIVNDSHVAYLEDLQSKFSCAQYERLIPIGFFDPQNYDKDMIDEKIAEYLEAQK